MKRVLFVDHAPFLGGGELSLLSILRHLDRTKFELYFAGTGETLKRAESLVTRAYNIELQKLTSIHFLSRMWRGAKLLRGAIEAISPELVCANTQRSALYCSRALRNCQPEFVIHLRDGRLLPLMGSPLSRADLIVVPSEFIKNKLGLEGNVRVVPSGVEREEFENCDSEGQADPPLVVSAGRMLEWKRHDLFLEVASQVRKHMPEVRFVLAGGPLGLKKERQVFDALKRRAEEAGVELPGQLPTIAPLLKTATVFVHCSRDEPFGRVVAEAMVSGLPVVAFDSGSMPEILADGAGVLVSDGDTTQMAYRVMQLLESPELREEFSSRAREKGRTFDARLTTTELQSLFSELLDRR